MKTFIPVMICLILTSCSYTTIRKINDSVRNEVSYVSNLNRGSNSKVNMIYRSYKITVKKLRNDSLYVYFNVNSTFPITQPDYFDTTYLVLPTQNFSYKLEQASQNIRFREKVDEISATTNTTTDVQVQNTTKVEPVTDNNTSTETRSSEVKTDTQTTTTTRSNTDTRVNTEILDKMQSERLIKIKVNDLKIASKFPSASIRLYTARNDDFWDIKLSASDLQILMRLINHQADY